jgi:hypothetical protein
MRQAFRSCVAALPLCVAKAIQTVGLWGPLALAGCDLTFTPEKSTATGPPRSRPDGITCGATVCEAGTVCCLQDGAPVCDQKASDVLFPPLDAAVEPGTCYGPYLACDGPEDCPGAYCCPLGILYSTDHTACTVDTTGFGVCAGFALPLCHGDSDCYGRCVLDDGGTNEYDPLAGYVSYCR